MPLRALALNCTLKRSPSPSSTELLLSQVLDALKKHDVEGDIVRMVDLNILPGVTSNEGPDDEWPQIRQRVLAADILVLGTPVWLGNPSSVCKRVLERMDAFLDETDDQGRMVSYGTVATVVVTGNEDGAHNIAAQLYQGLSDVGFTIPANAVSYWVGEAMGSTDYRELKRTPEQVKSATTMLASNAAHLARLLKRNPYPGPG